MDGWTAGCSVPVKVAVLRLLVRCVAATCAFVVFGSLEKKRERATEEVVAEHER